MQRNEKFREGAASMEQIVDYVKDTIEEAQRISSDLRPSVLDDKGLGAAVRWICRRYRDIYPDMRIQRRLEPEEIDVAQSLKVVVFRILQEAMNNVVKHSRADTVHLDIKKTDKQLALIFRDNGQGFEAGEESGECAEGGVGLMGMRERVELSGGTLNIVSGKGKGCVINAKWPLNGL
jgi:signal transduction histidine kinase